MAKLKTEKLKRADGTEVDALVVDASGKFPYLDESGAEQAGDFLDVLGKVKTMGAERVALTTRAQTAEAELAKWTPLGKLDEVAAGLQTVKDLKAGDLTRAEDVQRLKAQTKKEAEEAMAAQIQAANDKVRAMQERLDQSELLGILHKGSQATRPLANNKEVRVFGEAVDGTVLLRFLGDHFRKNEDGEWLAYENPADPRTIVADKDSLMPLKGPLAVQALVERNPSAKALLFYQVPGGGSGQSNSGGGGGGGKTITRAEHDAMPLPQRNQFFGEGGTIAG